MRTSWQASIDAEADAHAALATAEEALAEAFERAALAIELCDRVGRTAAADNWERVAKRVDTLQQQLKNV